jgi:hypothetical protein
MLLHAARLGTLTAAVKRRCALAAAWFARSCPGARDQMKQLDNERKILFL